MWETVEHAFSGSSQSSVVKFAQWWLEEAVFPKSMFWNV